jgi:hypothetical protein
METQARAKVVGWDAFHMLCRYKPAHDTMCRALLDRAINAGGAIIEDDCTCTPEACPYWSGMGDVDDGAALDALKALMLRLDRYANRGGGNAVFLKSERQAARAAIEMAKPKKVEAQL